MKTILVVQPGMSPEHNNVCLTKVIMHYVSMRVHV